MIETVTIQETFQLQVCYQLCLHVCFTSSDFYKAIISLIIRMLQQYFTVHKLYSCHRVSFFFTCRSARLPPKHGIFRVPAKTGQHNAAPSVSDFSGQYQQDLRFLLVSWMPSFSMTSSSRVFRDGTQVFSRVSSGLVSLGPSVRDEIKASHMQTYTT